MFFTEKKNSKQTVTHALRTAVLSSLLLLVPASLNTDFAVSVNMFIGSIKSHGKEGGASITHLC